MGIKFVIGGNCMSSKKSSPFQGNTAANAMYDYRKKEIQQNFLMSLPFLVVGLITTILGIVKFISISKQPVDITDNSETIGYDAGAWIVIAAVGLVVVLIGVINMLKATTAFATLAASLKNVESHISPFQSENLNRKVSAMNQPQTPKNSPAEGKKAAFGTRKDKQAPAAPKSNVAPPKPAKAVPMMEQKFDYGLHEEKELSFSEKFMRENKKDPFESYRKELGIKEEKADIFVQKPQFTRNTSSSAPVQQPVTQQSATQHSVTQQSVTQQSVTQHSVTQQSVTQQSVIQQSATQQPVTQKSKQQHSQTAPAAAVGFTKDEAKRAVVEHPSVKLNKPTETAPVQKTVSIKKPAQQKTPIKHSVPLQKTSVESSSIKVQTQTQVPAHSTSVVGMPAPHKPVVTPTTNLYSDTDEYDDMFFSFGSSVNKPAAVQTQRPVQNQAVSLHNYESVEQDDLFLFNENDPAEEITTDDMILNFEEVEREVVAETTVQEDFDEGEAYNFSLFEELDPKNKALEQAPQSVRGVPKDLEKANKQVVSSVLDFDSAESLVPPLDSITHTTVPTSSSSLSFGSFENDFDEDMDFDPQSFETSQNEQEYFSETSAPFADAIDIQTETPALYSENTESSGSQYNFSMFEQTEESDDDLFSQISELSQSAAYQHTTQQPVSVSKSGQLNQQYDISNFAPPAPQKTKPRQAPQNAPTKEEKAKKNGLGTLFSKKNKALDEKKSAPAKVEHPQEICTNGTRAQRKFVDASEYDEWKCPQCGNINQEYVGLCSCGARKPRAKR